VRAYTWALGRNWLIPSLLVVTYHLLKGPARYCDLGVNHFERIKPERQARSLVHRLNKLGYRVTIDREAA
jgi:hypothetical protein